MPALKSIVDSLVYAKINVVHWHLVDSQSFPFMRYFVLDASPPWRLTPVPSPTYPKLGSEGAWSPQERYTATDVAELVGDVVPAAAGSCAKLTIRDFAGGVCSATWRASDAGDW